MKRGLILTVSVMTLAVVSCVNSGIKSKLNTAEEPSHEKQTAANDGHVREDVSQIYEMIGATKPKEVEPKMVEPEVVAIEVVEPEVEKAQKKRPKRKPAPIRNGWSENLGLPKLYGDVRSVTITGKLGELTNDSEITKLVYIFYKNGNVKEQTAYASDGSQIYCYKYDENVKDERESEAGLMDDLDLYSDYKFDSRGNLIACGDFEKGKLTTGFSYRYDSKSNLIKVFRVEDGVFESIEEYKIVYRK